MADFLKRILAGTVVLAGIIATMSGGAQAVTINFLGTAGLGEGILGHAFVTRAGIPHMEGFYIGVGSVGPYTRLVSRDAFDTGTGVEVAHGFNGAPFAANAPASPALAALGINGSLHLSISGFTLDTSPGGGDLFAISATEEHRTYRNGSAAMFEQIAPGLFNQIASWSNGVFDVDIDYSDGTILNTFSGDLDPGSLSVFPESWTGTSFDPIDLAGSTPEGPYGAFSVTTAVELADIVIGEPEALALLSFGLIAAGRARFRSA